MDENKKQGKNIEIELSQAVAEGVYSNMAIISHSSSEFIMDFIRIMPGVPKAPVKSRVILTPEHAKRLLLSLQDNINKYEKIFGKIAIPQRVDSENGFPITFGNGQA
ncbi:MAG: DUF3467 domain-containing protein [Rikenellaceae bacterium]|nr:DUF3467 domain-containing protein [Rikenellaceae bacterium]